MEAASNPASNEVPITADSTQKLPRFKFKYQRRSWSVFKRSGSTDAPWYVHLEHGGKRFLRTLETTLRATAETRAKRIIDEIQEGKWKQPGAVSAPSRAPVRHATIGEVIAIYREAAPSTGIRGGVRQVSMVSAIQALRGLVREGLGVETGKELEASCGVLTAKFLREWRTRWMARYLQSVNGADSAAEAAVRNRAVRTGITKLGGARSVFNRSMLQVYGDRAVSLPDMTEFLKERVFGQMRDEYRPASDELVAQTFAAVRKLDTSDVHVRDMVLVFWVAIAGGLRKGEIRELTREDFVMVGAQPWIRSDRIGKGGERVEVPLIAGWNELQGLLPASGRLLHNNRRAFDDLGRWMRALGWRSIKKAHELRALMISRIVRESGNWEAARQWARHKDVATTQRKYGRYIGVQNIKVTLPG